MWSCLLLLSLAAPGGQAQVDPQGILRWQDGREIALFGVNYYPPCSIDYHSLKAVGADLRRVIDQDLLHFERLGLTALRLHVFDREISDHEGNLLDNEHLALLDYLIAEASRRGLVTILTPIAWWGTPNDSPGFSTIYDMSQMTSDSGAPRAAQRRYLAQFVQHRNRETGKTYAEDPAVLCFELINEPIYPPGMSPEQATEYIDALASAVRDTGCRKPIFYNGWRSYHEACAKSTLDGVTFGWYPTGLVYGRMRVDNWLNRVNDYPSMRDPVLKGKAIGVYEFDAADIGGSYMYPAMARAFRSGGAQFACQFQYDAWPLAASNCDWQTHFLSLPFAPGKALSFMIAGEAFRRLPRLKTYGETPAADRFGPFRVSYDEDLSEMVTDTEFLYSNTTKTEPPQPDRLVRIAGVGSSAVAEYDGTGAYFLDRVGPGAWRLEVYPDAIWVNDPFGRTQLSRETARVLWREHRLTLHLPDLGRMFTATPLNDGNRFQAEAVNGALTVQPGVYLLRKPGAKGVGDVSREYFAPPEDPALPPTLWQVQPERAVEGDPLELRGQFCGDEKVTLCFSTGGRWDRAPSMQHAPYDFTVILPAEAVKPPFVSYSLVVSDGTAARSYPGGYAGWPDEQTDMPPQVLFKAAGMEQAPELTLRNNPGAEGHAVIAVGMLRETVSRFDPTQDSVAALRVPAAAAKPSDEPRSVRIRARSLEPGTTSLEVGFVQADGAAYGWDVPLSSGWAERELPLTGLRPLWGTKGGRLDPSKLTEISLICGRWLYGPASDQAHGWELDEISLVPQSRCWRLRVDPTGPPVPLLNAEVVARQRMWNKRGALKLTVGPDGEPAVLLGHQGFGPPPDSLGLRETVPAQGPARLAALAKCDALWLTCRSLTPESCQQVEVVLRERDGAPWGTVVDVPADWQTVVVPLSKLRFFNHWPHPESRGGEGDRLHPEQIGQWNVTFGAWLNPDHAAEPHQFEFSALDLAIGEPAP